MPNFDPRMTRAAAVLAADANDLLTLVMQYTAFAANRGLITEKDVYTSGVRERKAPEFTAAPELTPIQLAEKQAEAWMIEGMADPER